MTEIEHVIAIVENLLILHDVPIKHRTKSLCLIAIYFEPENIRYVPDEFQKELSAYAVKRDPKALQYIKIEYMTEHMCTLAVLNDGLLLRYVPDNLKTITICLFACQNDVKAIRYATKEFIENHELLIKGVIEFTD
jgi:predicted MarR family transcription regulator